MTRHVLEVRHQEQLRKLGISEIPDHLDLHDAEYEEHYALWRATLPQASPQLIHLKALGHAGWVRHCAAAPEVKKEKRSHELRWIIALLAAIFLLLLFQPKAHAQFSKINTIQTKNQGTGVGFHASPFVFNCSTNMTCSDDGTTFTLTASSSAGTAWDSLTPPTAGGLTFQMFANGNALFTVKRKTDTTPTGTFFDFQNAAGGSLCKLNIDGSFTGCSFPYANLTGAPTLAQTIANGAHKWLNSYDASTGLFTNTQPACGDLSDAGAFCNGTAYSSLTGTPTIPTDVSGKKYLIQTADAALPNAQAMGALGTGIVKNTTTTGVQSIAVAGDFPTLNQSTSGNAATATALAADGTNCSGNNFALGVDASGNGQCAQPAFSNLSGSATTGQLPGSGATTVAGQTCTLGATCTVTHECADGLGDGLNAITAGTYVVTNCFNDFGATYTITAIRCFTDNSGSSTLNAANDAATGLLTGAVTCSSSFAAGTQSATTTIATSHWINFTFVADGTTKRATFEVTVTR